jgi:voltage-gated potassium channel Kch
VHVITRHLTYFGLLRPTAFGALTMKVVSAKRVSLAVRKYVAVRVQVSAASRLSTWLVDSQGKSVKTWGQRNVKAGTTILRLALPTTLARSGAYRIQVRATGRGQSIGRTAKVRLLTTPLTAPFTPKGKKVGIVLVKSDLIKRLKLDERFSIRPVTGSQVFDATGLRSAFVEAVVIDLDRESVATIAGLRQVFPELRIVALSNSPTAAAYARRAGASIVIMKPTSPELVAALVGQLIWR